MRPGLGSQREGGRAIGGSGRHRAGAAPGTDGGNAVSSEKGRPGRLLLLPKPSATAVRVVRRQGVANVCTWIFQNTLEWAALLPCKSRSWASDRSHRALRNLAGLTGWSE